MKTPQITLISITAAFICVLTGIFIGRNTTGNIILHPDDSTVSSEYASSKTSGKLDLNTATASQLQMLPGIGQVLAQRILTYRQENGPFTTTEELMNVDGISTKRLEEILDYITVGG